MSIYRSYLLGKMQQLCRSRFCGQYISRHLRMTSPAAVASTALSTNESSEKSGLASDLFKASDHASQYAKSRPGYPPEVFDTILEELKRTRGESALDLVVDVATGSGQAAISLAEHFPRVIGLDISQSQLDNAVQHERVTYTCAPAHETGLPDSCADLVTVAQGIHWFDLDKFYKEARRILKPGGQLAFWGYGLLAIENEDEVSKALEDLFNGKLGPYWHPNRTLVDEHYNTLEMPSKDLFPSVVAREFTWRRQASLEEVEGYVRSWSAYNAYMKRNAKEGGDGDDPAKELFSEKLPELFNDTRAKAALSNKNSLSTTFVTTRTPAFMRLCS